MDAAVIELQGPSIETLTLRSIGRVLEAGTPLSGVATSCALAAM